MENITLLAINKLYSKYHFLFGTLFVFSSIIYLFINKHSDWHGLTQDSDGDISFLDSCYYTLVTFSTIGYGDITPKSNRAKIMTMVIVVGLILNVYMLDI